jgi:hypothetical protein
METDLFGEPVPTTAPKPPAYDRHGTKPIPPVVIADRVAGNEAIPHRPYEIVKEDKTTTWIFYK